MTPDITAGRTLQLQIDRLYSLALKTMDELGISQASSLKDTKTIRSRQGKQVQPGENLHQELRELSFVTSNDARLHPSSILIKPSKNSTPSKQASLPTNSPETRHDMVIHTHQPELQPITTLVPTGSTPPSKNSLKKKGQLMSNKLRSNSKKRSDSKTPVLQHISAPIPTAGYLNNAHEFPTQTHPPQRLLLVLDLNGTLLYRPNASSNYLPRPFLTPFLDYCLANHSVLIWSSAAPQNVSSICAKLFRPHDRRTLLGEWARDTLGLTPEQYASKVQVYKRLDQIWHHPRLSASHPLASKGQRWGQENTLLIDDSPMKASAQPYNLLRIPEFVKDTTEIDVLGQVVGYIEEARRQKNVSAYICSRKFEVDDGWTWNWEKRSEKKERRAKGESVQELEMPREGSVASSDDEDGGVCLEGWLNT